MALTRMVIFLGIGLMLGGCGVRERLFGDGQSPDALPFNAKLTKGDDRRDIAVRVRAGGVTVNDVRESVRFQATRYCLATYGASDTRWRIDPATGDWAFTREGQDMIFNGRCTAR